MKFSYRAYETNRDRLLCATEFLHRRLEKIKEIRSRPGSGFRDPNPTLADIEQTHILKFVEYNKELQIVLCVFLKLVLIS